MRDNSILLAFVNAAAFMLSTSFVFYVTCILVPYIRRKPAPPGEPTELRWHFLVPCLDEERVIEATVRRLRSDFPSAHVWCVDDASVDSTPDILAGLAARDRHVHVVTRTYPEAQVGKGPALNAGWRAIRDWESEAPDADRVVVGVVDADGHLDPDCLDVLSRARYFGDRSIDAIQIQVRVHNSVGGGGGRLGRVLVRLQDLEFTAVIAAMQMLRHNLGSVGMGGNGQFTRLSALNRIAAEYGDPWKAALIEDFELGLHVLLTGGRTEYCHDTSVWQQGLETFKLLVRQRSRWGQGVMQCMRYLGPIMRSPNVPTGAAVEIAYFLFLPWLQVLGDVVYAVATATLAYEAFTAHGGLPGWLQVAGGWQVVPVFVLFGLAPVWIWGPVYRRRVAPELSRTQGFLLGVANWPYLLVHHCAAWWAFSRMVVARHDWKKTERLDERPVLAQWARPRWEPARVRYPIRVRPRSAPGRYVVVGRLKPAARSGGI